MNVNAWDDYNNYVRMLISIGMFNKYVQQLINHSIIIMMWDKSIFVHQHKNYWKLHFFEYCMVKGNNMTNQIAKVKSMVQVLKYINQPIINELIITKIICSLPPSYNSIIVTWDNFPRNDQTICKITMHLFKHEHLKKVQGGNDNDGNHIFHTIYKNHYETQF